MQAAFWLNTAKRGILDGHRSLGALLIHGRYQAFWPLHSADVCLRTAKELWTNKEALSQGELHLSDVPHVTGFHALCGYCDWNGDCPKFHDGDNQPAWESELEKLVSLKDARAALDVEISLKERYLKDAYALSSLQGDWINTGS